MTHRPLTVGVLRAELVGFPDGAPVTVTVRDRAQPSIAAILPIVGAGYGPGVDAGGDPVLAASFPLTAAPHDTESADSDEWGVPDRLLGPMPDAFYGAVGRVVALSALLEDLLRSLLQAIQRASQDAHAKQFASQIAATLRREAADLGADWSDFPRYLDAVEGALTSRNALVHSLWQPKPEGFYGHRLDRTADRVSTTTTLVELRGSIRSLVGLIDGWQRWFMLAGALPWPDQDGPSSAP